MTAATSTREFVLRRHDGKHTFFTWQEAQAALFEVWRQRLRAHFERGVEPDRIEKSWYRCLVCGWFHLTSMDQPGAES